ncbi:MAG: hypothetical protein Q7J54_06600 [Candidatus Woesearchaeota archaeon]|nr:hypothetical protein [Candidatus Woesearchaeota archaeon]
MKIAGRLIEYCKAYIKEFYDWSQIRRINGKYQGLYRTVKVPGMSIPEDTPELTKLIDGIPPKKIAEVTKKIFIAVEQEENRTGYFIVRNDGLVKLVLQK